MSVKLIVVVGRVSVVHLPSPSQTMSSSIKVVSFKRESLQRGMNTKRIQFSRHGRRTDETIGTSETQLLRSFEFGIS